VKVLGFDCAGGSCSAAVLADGKILARRFSIMERGQSEALMPMIEAVLAEARLELSALDLLSVTTGPGGFTGLRIGLAAARGLGLASGLPVLGVTCFAAVAEAAADENLGGLPLVVALESKREELYLQTFAGAVPGEPALAPASDWAPFVPHGPVLLAGHGARRLAAALGRNELRVAAGPGHPDAAEVARLGAKSWRPGLKLPPSVPLYLRAPDTTLIAAPGTQAVTISIRPVQGTELAILAVLHAACFREDAWDVAALTTMLGMPGTSAWVAYRETGAACGFVIAQTLGDEAEILTLGVAPEARRQRVARRLLSDLIARLSAAGTRQLWLEVAADNLAGLGLYQGLGFVGRGRRRDYYRRETGETVDALRLVLEISPENAA